MVEFGKYHFGLIAQDIINSFEDNNMNYKDYDIISEIVTNEIISLNGFDSGDKIYRLNYDNLHAYHIAFGQEIYKELNSKIDMLKKEISKLKSEKHN